MWWKLSASLIAQTRANELGFDQVLWLDGVEQKYIEEVGDRYLLCNRW